MELYSLLLRDRGWGPLEKRTKKMHISRVGHEGEGDSNGQHGPYQSINQSINHLF